MLMYKFISPRSNDLTHARLRLLWHSQHFGGKDAEQTTTGLLGYAIWQRWTFLFCSMNSAIYVVRNPNSFLFQGKMWVRVAEGSLSQEEEGHYLPRRESMQVFLTSQPGVFIHANHQSSGESWHSIPGARSKCLNLSERRVRETRNWTTNSMLRLKVSNVSYMLNIAQEVLLETTYLGCTQSNYVSILVVSPNN